MGGVISEGEVAERTAAVRGRIAAAGGGADVTLVAVTKGFGPDVVAAAVAAGIEDVGESYAQELLAKAAAVPRPPRWHLVGRLQANKVRALAGTVDLWQSVDRARLADELRRRAPGARVLVQVDVTGEPTKGGCPPGEVPALVDRLRDAGLDVRGLMAVGPLGPAEDARPGFRALTALADRLGLDERSMGMSDDLEVAVEEGATMVRVGTALFGARPPRAGAPHMGH
jgi:pyridoxal phosphate enzyme (YggS family)